MLHCVYKVDKGVGPVLKVGLGTPTVTGLTSIRADLGAYAGSVIVSAMFDSVDFAIRSRISS